VKDWNLVTARAIPPVTSASMAQIPATSLKEQPDSHRLPWSFLNTFTWNGEVEDPRPVFPESKAGVTFPTGNMENKKVLPDGDYFLMVVVYKKDRRYGFARNQFKLLNDSRDILEFGNWVGNSWNNTFIETAQKNTTKTILIPDELFPIRVEGLQPTITLSVK